MSIVRWDPLASAEEAFNQMLPSLLGRWPRVTLNEGAGQVEWRPSADISETDKEYLIRAELPAVKKEGVRVTVDNGMLTIQGERTQAQEDKNERYHRIEAVYGSFQRSFALPDNANAEAIRCESKDGVLTVHVPKVAQTEKQKAKQIKVE